MATTSHAAIVVILYLLLLASAQSSLVHARMMSSDHLHVYAKDSSASTDASSSSISQDMLRVFMASSSSPEAKIATANRRRIIQVVEGSVPSPGIGHHG